MSTTLKDEASTKSARSAARNRSLRVALFGYYKYGNFGDDLMAVLIGNELRSSGIDFTVFGLLPEIADEFGFERTDSIDGLLDGADALIFGGGGAFLRSEDHEFHRDISRICEICAQRGIPIIMVSVGGDGQGAVGLHSARLAILRQAEHITFRNEEDEVLAVQMSGTYQVNPDLVWLAAKNLGSHRVHTNHPLIAIDATLTERASIKWYLRLLTLICRVFGKRYEFVYFSTTHSSVKVTKGRTLGYKSIKEFSSALSATSLIITPRLHAGLFALSQGIPVMLLAPHGKADLLFKRLHLDWFIFKGKWQALRLLKALLSSDQYDSEFQPWKWASFVDGAENHLKQLREELANLGSTPSARRHS